ncbi:putative disease resistance protein RGA1 [Sorghum bicolor]|uniref:putative disease resistance protein RGA1 n=1 Tax=Sorghum bicolor TaxID=4558 RepID=UPI000B42564C|nr:putative disease resistance protein RGA1 [Sorghum bicolor]|eukprot:XP_021317837.1 putative disease resistance protein RGA1 [Sorghum bicolor]
MAEAVAGSLASAFVDVAKDKLRSILAGPASLLWNSGNDMEDMNDVLETISAVLEDAESRSVKEKLVRLWLKRLKDVALDISDMLEDYQDIRDQPTAAKMPVILSYLPAAYNKIAMANTMKTLRERLREIRNEIDSFNFIRGKSTTKDEPYDERETTSYLPQEPVIGRDREKQEIIKLLSANTNNDEIAIVPIYGLGGMGKSTLAQLVYNDAQFMKYDHRIWVYVSQDFNLNKIGSSIISQLQPEGGQQNMCIQQVINQCLERLLHGKKVLVVLDDLWEEKKTELDKLRRMLHIKGSKVDIIITTRKEEIARKVSTSEPYKLRPLEDDICWEIIKRSSRFGLKSNQEQLEKIGLDIAKKCGGVALATQAIGFMLRSIDDLSGWTKINNSDIWNGSYEDNDVLPSLTLSYERMSPQLRICFSYCAIFPKGHNIIKVDLVEQWIALDFITERSKGKEYIEKLIGMSFLQVSKLHLNSKEYVVCYTMHDLVHDLARLTMSDELIFFDVAPPRNTSAHKNCRYSWLRKCDRTMKLANMPSKIRALRFSHSGEPLDIPNGAFSFAKYLRTLNFSECSGILLPASIGKLKQLRCLIAPRMQNESLPECITELSKLQYLNINGSSKISALPESIGKLGCLKYLHMSGCSNISKLPESFGDLKCMVILDMSGCTGITELPDSLGNLTNLQLLQLSGCSNLKAIPESLYGLTQLQYLNLSFCRNLDQLPKTIGMLGCLKYLSLSSCSGMSKLPESFGDLKCMVHLDMPNCAGIMELPDSLGNLMNLQYLQLSGCSNLKAIPESLCTLTKLQYLNLSSCFFLDRIPEAIGNLIALKYLNMSSCDKIRELPESLMKLQNLLHLDLSRCRGFRKGSLGALCGLTTLQHLDMSQLRSIDLEDLSDVLENLTKLKYLRLSLIDSLPESIGNLTNLEHLDLSGNCLPCLPQSIGNLKRLHTLDLSYCFGLKSLPESIGALGLKYLWLNMCSPELIDHASSLVHFSQTLPFFRVRADDVSGCSNLHLLERVDASDLRIRSLENVRYLEEANKVKLLDKQILSKLTLTWTVDAVRLLEDKDLLEQLMPPRGLNDMHLEGYSSTSLPVWFMGISHHLTNLTCMFLEKLPMCSNLPPLGQLPNLEILSLSKLSSIKKIDREFCGGKGAFRRLSNFFIEKMEGLEEWNTTYSVEDGVEEFMFPVLDSLTIQYCPRLRLKPCPPTFHECIIYSSDQVISSIEEVDKTSHHCSSSSRAIKLDLIESGHSCKSIRVCHHCAPSRAVKLDLEIGSESIRLFHHFPLLRELRISGYELTSVPESMRRLASLEMLELEWCDGISALPEWLDELSSLKSLVISGCKSIKSLPPCIQHLTKLQKLHIRNNQQLKEWCESEENKTKLAHINVSDFNAELHFYLTSPSIRVLHALNLRSKYSY